MLASMLGYNSYAEEMSFSAAQACSKNHSASDYGPVAAFKLDTQTLLLA